MSSSSRNSRVRIVAQVVGAGAVACAAMPASAAGAWVYEPRVEVGAQYDDNYRLTDQPGQEIDVTGAEVDALLAMRRDDQRSLLELTPRIHSTYFPNATTEDATDYYLNALAERRAQRLTSSFLAQVADESVVSSELPLADFPGIGLGQTVSGDTGSVTVRNRRRFITATPSLTYAWTERRHLEFDLRYADAKFQDTLFEQIGYTDYRATAGIIWDASQRHTFAVRAHGERFSPDDNSPDTDTTGVVAEWRTSASAITSYYVRVGTDRSERNATGTTAELSGNSFNGGIGAAWQFQTTRMVIDALRSAAPSGSGAVVERTELRFRMSHDFQPRLSGFLALRGIRTEGLDNSVARVRSRKYATGTTGLEWRANRRFSIRGAYDYTWQEYQDQPDAAVSNGVIVSLVYEPRRLK